MIVRRLSKKGGLTRFPGIIIPYAVLTRYRIDNRLSISEDSNIKLTPYQALACFSDFFSFFAAHYLRPTMAEVTPASTPAQGVTQPCLSQTCPAECLVTGLFVKLLCSVCSCSPPLSLLTALPIVRLKSPALFRQPCWSQRQSKERALTHSNTQTHTFG